MTAAQVLAAFLCAAMEFQRRRTFRTDAEVALHADLLRFAYHGCAATRTDERIAP